MKCQCPAIPPITPELLAAGLPLACACCGEPLELTCRNVRRRSHVKDQIKPMKRCEFPGCRTILPKKLGRRFRMCDAHRTPQQKRHARHMGFVRTFAKAEKVSTADTQASGNVIGPSAAP